MKGRGGIWSSTDMAYVYGYATAARAKRIILRKDVSKRRKWQERGKEREERREERGERERERG